MIYVVTPEIKVLYSTPPPFSNKLHTSIIILKHTKRIYKKKMKFLLNSK